MIIDMFRIIDEEPDDFGDLDNYTDLMSDFKDK